MSEFDNARKSMRDQMKLQEEEKAKSKREGMKEQERNAEAQRQLFEKSQLVSLMKKIHTEVLGNVGRLVVSDHQFEATYIYDYMLTNVLYVKFPNLIEWAHQKEMLETIYAPSLFPSETAQQLACHYILKAWVSGNKIGIFRNPCLIETQYTQGVDFGHISHSMIAIPGDSLHGYQEGIRFQEKYSRVYDSFKVSQLSVASELERRLGALIGNDESVLLFPEKINEKITELFNFVHGPRGEWVLVRKERAYKGIHY